jgi:alpha-amylase/alpha-mannosidase (GH57 family)
VVIHGHFYQPPREDPWFGLVPRQPSAAPFHDWNARIERECYGPVTAAWVLGPGGRIAHVLNALEYTSFDFGPTLLRWLEREAPGTYARVLDADRRSRRRTGRHGNAVAMPYHHVILPLSTRRDKTTEVRWGIHDFRHRFGRDPEGMWLPETAVDDETLDVLAQEGIAFTVVAPHQVERAPARGMPGLYRTRAGRSITVFVYDGPVSHGIAFGEHLRDAGVWAERMAARSAPNDGPELLSAATDGESYGHHQAFGEMALAAAIRDLSSRETVRLENFSSFLSRHQPREEIVLVEPSSWSCAHGIDRWRRDCGCKLEPDAPTQQAWRGPLRGAAEWLASELHAIYEQEAGERVSDPWRVRDEYGRVVEGTDEERRKFLAGLAALAEDETRTLTRLLEMERQALALFTSCGWFFDDLARIETVQVLKHAARAIELAGSQSSRLEAGFRELLASARSNEPAPRNGARVYDQDARPSTPHLALAAAGFAYARANGFGEALQRLGDIGGSAKDGAAVVVDTRSGVRRSFRYQAPRTGAATIEVTDDEGSGRWTYPASAVPEEATRVVREGVRAHLLDTWVTAAERHGLIAGHVDEIEVIGLGLARAIRALADLEADEVGARAAEWVRGLDALDVEPPRRAQTALWQLHVDTRGRLAKELNDLAWRLGFDDLERGL